MKGKTIYMLPEDNRFETISDFKWCLKCGGEIQFRWKCQDYGVVRYGLDKKITVYRAHDKASQRAFDSSDEALEYMIGDDRLRDIITQVEVLFRSIKLSSQYIFSSNTKSNHFRDNSKPKTVAMQRFFILNTSEFLLLIIH